MTQQELQVKLNELNDDTEFVSKMADCQNIDEIVALFHTEGIDIPADELEKSLQSVSVQVDNDGELNEDSLENVSGGVLFSTLCAAWMCSNILICGGTVLKAYFNRKKR